jgi:hypothetical protein
MKHSIEFFKINKIIKKHASILSLMAWKLQLKLEKESTPWLLSEERNIEEHTSVFSYDRQNLIKLENKRTTSNVFRNNKIPEEHTSILFLMTW